MVILRRGKGSRASAQIQRGALTGGRPFPLRSEVSEFHPPATTNGAFGILGITAAQLVTKNSGGFKYACTTIAGQN